ncbi:MAG: ATP-binding cassette domain-containing protein [Kineosporiaceae bacterium]
MLQTIDLTRRFGDLTAVDQVSLDVPGGMLTGFVGANGAGKTTTMRLITGVLGSHGGQVLWQGRPITAADRRRFGYMPEERGLYPKQPVLDQLIYLGRLTGLTAAEARSRATTLLERFGLADRTKERVEKLSLGNQQRVQIVAAVISSPIALILDEPFSGLDPVAVEQMAGVVREHAANGLPVLFSSHQLDLMERLCDRVAIMSRGRLVTQGRVDDLRRTTTPRYRLALDVDAGWVRGTPGVNALDVDGSSALIELDDPEAGRHLLREALSRGAIREFSPVVPSLTELYKEVAA